MLGLKCTFGSWCRVTTWAVILHQLIQSLSVPTRNAIPQTPPMDAPGVSPSTPALSQLSHPSPKPRMDGHPAGIHTSPELRRNVPQAGAAQPWGKLLVQARGAAPPACALSPPGRRAHVALVTTEPALGSNNSLCSAGPRTTPHCGQLPGPAALGSGGCALCQPCLRLFWRARDQIRPELCFLYKLGGKKKS